MADLTQSAGRRAGTPADQPTAAQATGNGQSRKQAEHLEPFYIAVESRLAKAQDLLQNLKFITETTLRTVKGEVDLVQTYLLDLNARAKPTVFEKLEAGEKVETTTTISDRVPASDKAGPPLFPPAPSPSSSPNTVIHSSSPPQNHLSTRVNKAIMEWRTEVQTPSDISPPRTIAEQVPRRPSTPHRQA